MNLNVSNLKVTFNYHFLTLPIKELRRYLSNYKWIEDKVKGNPQTQSVRSFQIQIDFFLFRNE